jgi:hypothetical protein
MKKPNAPAFVSARFVLELISSFEGRIAVSLADWAFLIEFDRDIYRPLGADPLAEGPHIPQEIAETGPVGFFELPNAKDTEFLERLLRSHVVKLYVGEPGTDFFSALPPSLLQGLSVIGEFGDAALQDALLVQGHKWFVLADGNERQMAYYYFASAS